MSDFARATTRLGDFEKAILISKNCSKAGRKNGGNEEVIGSYLHLAALMEAGEWQEIPEIALHHQQVITKFLETELNQKVSFSLVNTSYFLNYLYDAPRLLHYFRNRIGDICCKTIDKNRISVNANREHQSMPKAGKLRIGYIASTLTKHSVGWLSRWIFQHHNRSNYQVFIYNVNTSDACSFAHDFFVPHADVSHYLGGNAREIAGLISQDEIDILVDLDSLALTTTYNVLCYKPAPIQITWLGWDTSGCPEIDYFIADPHVLPADAEEYYRTKIWRLPQTYVAIDGFEVEVPTKRREDYQIPADAIVYLCAQKSYKHHPDILRLQMQIIKQVPNSYLLVQLRANPESLMKIYRQLADEVGISMEQLRFIKPDPDEMTHRLTVN